MLGSTALLPLLISPYMIFQDLSTNISVVVAIPIVVKPNTVLKTESVNILAFHISPEKK